MYCLSVDYLMYDIAKKLTVQFNSLIYIALSTCNSIAETSNYSKITPNFFSFVYQREKCWKGYPLFPQFGFDFLGGEDAPRKVACLHVEGGDGEGER